MGKVCKNCGMNGHSATFCWAHPKTPLKRRTLRRLGKYGKKWLKARADWFKENPSEFYTCYLCGDRLTPKETTLDHIKSRSRHPELRYEFSNLAPCCWRCNRLKGSRDLEELEEANYGRN